ncbi:hypothetical protein GBA52_027632 [Prunus armeniaca]|nr:hypothetical protein GBA52_027632 [Prunus armeniaca]
MLGLVSFGESETQMKHINTERMDFRQRVKEKQKPWKLDTSALAMAPAPASGVPLGLVNSAWGKVLCSSAAVELWNHPL